MSQYDLAERMHVDHSKINRLENNKRRLTFEDLIYYSQIFNISLDELTACERKNKQYDTIKIYTFSGSSPSYELTNGLLVLSKEKIYFQIGSIDSEVENIKIFIKTNKERRLVYDGEYLALIQDNYGYESFISYNDFISGNQKVFVRIGNEEIPLNFIKKSQIIILYM